MTCNADIPRDAITVTPNRMWRYHHRMAQLGVTPLILHLELPFLGKALGPILLVSSISKGGSTGTRRRGTKSHATAATATGIAGLGPISTSSGFAPGPSPGAKDQLHLRGVLLPGQKGCRIFGHPPLPLVGAGAAGPAARAAVGCIRHTPRYSRDGRTGRRGRGSPARRRCHHATTTTAADIAIVLLLFVAVDVAAVVVVVVVPKAATTTTATAATLAIELGIKFILGGQNFHIGPIEEMPVVVRRAQRLILDGFGMRLLCGGCGC